MTTNSAHPVSPDSKKRLDWLHILLIVVVTILVTVGVTIWVIKAYVFPSEFKPVALTLQEEQILHSKLERLQPVQPRPPGHATGKAEPSEDIQPEPYSEEGAKREIVLSERELNGLMARKTDLARKVAIDLSDDLMSAKILVPLSEDFPVLGGQTLKVHAGVELAYKEGEPVVILKGISVMGVPLPNAWLGGIKNIDLVQEYGTEPGFWKAFSEGVEDIHIESGLMVITLKE